MNGFEDVFVHDLRWGTTRRVSIGPGGKQGDRISFHPRLSLTGRWVAFDSAATNLVPLDTNEATDVFVRSR